MKTAALFAGVCGLGSASFGAISSVGTGDFGPGTTTITFSEVAVGTTIPFSIGIANFAGLSGLVSNDDLGSAVPPSPSGRPFLYTGSVENDDWVEVLLGAGQTAVGAYFDIAGAGGSTAQLRVEFYNDATLLGTVDAVAVLGTTGGFVGGMSDSTLINRVIFREIDGTSPISFRLDDMMFVPTPATCVLLAGMMIRPRRRT